jgi:hypothetical protein
MKSPFPGMDPYLESHWLDVHSSLVTDARNTLNQLLPEDLAASSEERVSVESSDDARDHQYYPDVRVFKPGGGVKATTYELDPAGGVIVAPVRLLVQLEPMTERYIRIVETGTERLITIIEFISPSNKIGRAVKEFRANRRELLEANVSFVEVDLCRTGDWEELLHPWHCKPKDVSTYRVIVRTPGNPGEAFLYPISLRAPLPSIAIPLRPDERMVMLDLQPLIERAYVGGRYGRRLNYRVPPEPPLEGDDAVWANELLAARR